MNRVWQLYTPGNANADVALLLIAASAVKAVWLFRRTEAAQQADSRPKNVATRLRQLGSLQSVDTALQLLLLAKALYVAVRCSEDAWPVLKQHWHFHAGVVYLLASIGIALLTLWSQTIILRLGQRARRRQEAEVRNLAGLFSSNVAFAQGCLTRATPVQAVLLQSFDSPANLPDQDRQFPLL